MRRASASGNSSLSQNRREYAQGPPKSDVRIGTRLARRDEAALGSAMARRVKNENDNGGFGVGGRAYRRDVTDAGWCATAAFGGRHDGSRRHRRAGRYWRTRSF